MHFILSVRTHFFAKLDDTGHIFALCNLVAPSDKMMFLVNCTPTLVFDVLKRVC